MRWFFVFFCMLASAVAQSEELPEADHCVPLPAYEGAATAALQGAEEAYLPRRKALVIGVADYRAIAPLANPVNDAVLVADSLRKLGFEVLLLVDATADSIAACSRTLVDSAADADVALFYFAGHGIQVDDANYLVGVDSGRSVDGNAGLVPIGPIVDALRAAAPAALVFLDACRNNPFGDDQPQGLNVSTGRGAIALQIENPRPFASEQASGMFVAYATSPNSVATDGAGANSPFSSAFAKAILTPGYSIQRVMSEVNRLVGAETDWQQTPWSRSSLAVDLKLAGSLTKEEALSAAENAAGRSKAVLDRGDRRQAIVEALKGFPKAIGSADLEGDFAVPMRALARAYRSSRVRIDVDVMQPYPLVKSSDSKRVAAGVKTDVANEMILWDTETGAKLSTLVSLPRTSLDIYLLPQFSGDGRFIAVNTGPRTAAVWSSADAERIFEIEACTEAENAVSSSMPAKLNFDGSRLYFDGCVYNVLDGQLLWRLDLTTIRGAATAAGIDIDWLQANLGYTLWAGFLGYENALLFRASAGAPPRSLIGFLDVESGSISLLGLPENYGQVDADGQPPTVSLKTRRVLLGFWTDSRYTMVLINTEDGAVVWEHQAQEWSLAGLSPDGTLLARIAPTRWEFYDAKTGASLKAPRGLEDADFETFGDIYNMSGTKIMANYPSPLEDLWKDVPSGSDLIETTDALLSPAERAEVLLQRLDYWPL